MPFESHVSDSLIKIVLPALMYIVHFLFYDIQPSQLIKLSQAEAYSLY